MRNMNLAAAALLGMAISANAATVTFSGVPAQAGHVPGDGWWGNPSGTYQPLMGGYVVGSVVDGGDLGVTVDMTPFISDRGSDHTGDAPADYFIKGWSGATQNLWTMTFDQAVTVDSLFVSTDWNAGNRGSQLAVYTDAADTTPAKVITLPWTAVWNGVSMVDAFGEFTDFAGIPTRKLVLIMPADGGGSNVRLDDMTISVPEPAIAGLFATSSALAMLRRRRTSR